MYFVRKVFVYILVIISTLPLFFSGCANSSVAPSGGPKDTIPPVLLTMSPEYKATNFNGKNLILSFNEYIQLKDQNKQFTMSPPIEKRPELRVRGRQVIVSFKSDLQPNTTYYIDFGTSIVDLNESNPTEYMATTFSTGDYIDSMIYAGRLVDAFTLEPVVGSFAYLYEDNIDSLPYLVKPNALALSDKDGVYLTKGLKNIKYKLFALDDKNADYKYDPGNEAIAFADSLIRPLQISESDSLAFDDLPILRVFTENARKQYLASYKQPEKRLLELIFNQVNPEIKSFAIDKLTDNDFIVERTRWNDTLKYWIKTQTIPDTLSGVINYMRPDSSNQLVLTEVKLKFELEKQDKKAEAQPAKPKKDNKTNNEQNYLTPSIVANPTQIIEKNVRINFKTPLIKYDTSLVKLYRYNDAQDKKSTITYQIAQDTLHIREYMLKTKWETATKYELQIMPSAFTDIYEHSNDTIIQTIETANPDKFSSITVNLTSAKTSYIIQLLKGKEIVAQKLCSTNCQIRFDYLEPSKYRIRVIEDKNNNGIWDTGNYLQKIQPEWVSFVKFEDGKDELELRQNWEIKQTVDVSKIFKE